MEQTRHLAGRFHAEETSGLKSLNCASSVEFNREQPRRVGGWVQALRGASLGRHACMRVRVPGSHEGNVVSEQTQQQHNTRRGQGIADMARGEAAGGWTRDKSVKLHILAVTMPTHPHTPTPQHLHLHTSSGSTGSYMPHIHAPTHPHLHQENVQRQHRVVHACRTLNERVGGRVAQRFGHQHAHLRMRRDGAC
eukprot:350115-Chlamydomonas_euryale.AAC.2